MIHPTAIVHAKAKLDPSVSVGPYSVIGEGVEMGPGCVVGPHAFITGVTRIGSWNRFHAGCVIGDEPQDLKYKGEPTGLTIGNENVFREHVTVHRSTKPSEQTVVGSNNLLMAHCHVGHNSTVGNHVIIANGALLGGHVMVQDRAFISGNCLMHQFVRVGTLALMQGGSAVSKDLPPFTIARGDNGICGLNIIGLRRAGISTAERMELKQLYVVLFRSGQLLAKALEEARTRFKGAAAGTLMDFVGAARRGVCADVGRHKAGADEEDEAD